MDKRPAVIFSAFVFLLLLSGCTQKTDSPAGAGETARVTFTVTGYQGKIAEKLVDAEKGANAFEVMKKNMNVEYAMYSLGPLITEIEGAKPEGSDYWALYVDGNYAEKGIADYSLDKDMKIEWKIEKSPY